MNNLQDHPDAGEFRVVIVEDDRKMLDILKRHVARMGYGVRTASDAAGALEILRSAPADIVLTDIRMPGMDGRSLLPAILDKWPETKVVLMTAFGSVDAAVDAMQAGAYSYICKPFRVDEVAGVLRNATREIGLTRRVRHLAQVTRSQYSADRLIGTSPAMQQVRQLVTDAAKVSAPVLITGRSGTGKELAARAIHYLSARAKGTFIAVNCAAIPETLFESEMFGCQRGAFTGATADRPGLIERSSGGSLCLDEVGEIPFVQQAKLLRVIEEHEIRRLGATKSTPVDLRIISATNRSLEAMVQRGEFREDLYFRLNVLHIQMPELLARPGDIPMLADHLLAELIDDHSIPCHGFEPEVLETLASRRWPGNVRELRNAIERALVRAGGRHIKLSDLPDREDSRPVITELPDRSADTPCELQTLVEIEKEHIELVLRKCGWNRSVAAATLGIDRRTLFSKIQRYGLLDPDTTARKS